MIDRLTRGRELFCGGMNRASVNVAEMMPYFQALTWYDAQYGRDRLRNTGHLNAHIITDSRTIANWGNRCCNLSLELPRTSIIYQAGIRELFKLGYQMIYHWAPRSDSGLNYLADLIAALARREIIRVTNRGEDTNLARAAARAIERIRFADPETGEPINIYDINPDEDPHGETLLPEGQRDPASQPQQHPAGGA